MDPRLKQARKALGGNPLINKKKVKPGDVVVMRMPCRYEQDTINLFKVTSINYQPPDEDLNYMWADLEGKVIYTNKRLGKDLFDKGICNCLGITEIVPKALIDNYVDRWNMFDPRDHPLTEEEMEATLNSIS